MEIQFYQYRPLQLGFNLFLVGNIKQLGEWNPKKAIPLKQKKLDEWHIDIQINDKCIVEYKYIEINNEYNEIVWDQGLNRKLDLTQERNKQSEYSIMTFNLRYDTHQDKENRWDKRKQYVIQLLQSYQLDFIGFQEVLLNQFMYLNENLFSFNSIGRGRRQQYWNDEGCPIFYDMRKWKVIEYETFWLSNRPDQPESTSYGNNLPRICTYIKFKNYNNDIVNVYNCHLDHINSQSQILSAIQIKEHMAIVVKQGENTILMGDFNSTPLGKPLSVFVNEGNIKLQKTYSLSHIPMATFHNYQGFQLGIHIDYILIDNELKQLEYEIIRNSYNKKYPSDHFPVRLKVEKKKQIEQKQQQQELHIHNFMQD